MTPLTTLADATDIYTARSVTETLSKAGYIIVRKDAIERAQREAVAAYREDAGEWWRLPTTATKATNGTRSDNDNPPRKPPAPADWHGIKGDPPKRAA